MALKDIVGQHKAVEILLGILRNGNFAGSYLFCGEGGIGKKKAAISFAKAMNCEKGKPDEPSSLPLLLPGQGSNATLEETGVDACDICDSCRKIDAGVHPDFLLVSPEEKQIRIEEIRIVEEALSFKSYEGKKKTIIVDEAETMNAPAANAFLKTLEEPPENSVLILVSARPEMLPPTIVSRCSRINFSPLSFQSSREVLRGKVAEKDLDLAARLSMGRPGLAVSADLLEERAWFIDLFESMVRAEKDGWASREDMDRWFEYATVFFRDLAVLKITGDRSLLINEDLCDYFAKLSKSVDVTVIIKVQKSLSALKDKLMFNLNKSITWNYTASLLRKELPFRNA